MVVRTIVLVLSLALWPCTLLAQQKDPKDPTWQEGTVVRIDTGLLFGSHMDKSGTVSVWRGTGCGAWKKCGWWMKVEVRQSERKLFLQKKIYAHINHLMPSMHYEDVNLREGDRVRLRDGEQKDICVLLDRDGKPHDFSVEQVVPLSSQSPQSGREASAHSAALPKEAATSQVKPPLWGTLGIEASDWEQSGFTGVEITDISQDGSAALARLHKGDVITELNGKKIRSAQDFTSAMDQTEPGSKVSIVYLVKTNLGWMPKETIAVVAKGY